MIKDSKFKPSTRGRVDETIYCFYHEKYGYKKVTMYDLTKEFNLHRGSVSNLVAKKVAQHKGWKIDEPVKITGDVE